MIYVKQLAVYFDVHILTFPFRLLTKGMGLKVQLQPVEKMHIATNQSKLWMELKSYHGQIESETQNGH